jgi:hypothetical protein
MISLDIHGCSFLLARVKGIQLANVMKKMDVYDVEFDETNGS